MVIMAYWVEKIGIISRSTIEEVLSLKMNDVMMCSM